MSLQTTAIMDHIQMEARQLASMASHQKSAHRSGNLCSTNLVTGLPYPAFLPGSQKSQSRINCILCQNTLKTMKSNKLYQVKKAEINKHKNYGPP